MLDDIFESINKNVSRETFSALQEFVKILMRWNKKINLMSKRVNEIEIWKDHILDSILISSYIKKKDKLLMDVGSGAGFPGIILSIIGHTNCMLVEMNSKKSAFLNIVITELGLRAKVENTDVKLLQGYNPFYITSRAVAPIFQIIKMTERCTTLETEFIFHIGKKDVVQEIKLLGKSFKLQEWQNPYKDRCKIVSIKKIKERDI
ncbi:MAG: 16S rRNA (guanine(527)-N(7))-methyltransferase RsmG [Candidatus Midichloria sp.]|nr:MAG: 16S rRNA (guanine(527)-N(7))-methyltransferase RsmG [Candidatus Midichloria sp.]